MDSSDSDVPLSPSYLQRHSRQTCSNDMAPFARSTCKDVVDVEGERMAEGANAVALLTRAARKAVVFMVLVG